MSAKMLGVLAVLAIVLGGIALAIVGRGDATGDPQELGPLFPGLYDRLNDAAELEVTTPDGGFTARREADAWVLVEKSGYPVRVGEVKETLVALAELEKRQAMTSDPARYDRLGVQDVDAEGAQSKRVVVRDEAGQELAALLVGQPRGGGRGPAASFYGRVPGEERSWRLEGRLDLPADGNAWLDKEPVKLERGEVQAVRTAHPDGEVVLVSRDSRDQESFDVHDVPEGRELRYPTVASGVGSALEYLSFQDVTSTAEFEAPEADPVVTTFWTFDGLRLDVRVWSRGEDEHWAAFEASHDPDGPEGVALAGPPSPGEEGEGEAEEPAPAEPGATPEEVQARVAELTRRVDGWVYRIAPYNKGNLAKRMDDLTRAPEPPESIAAPEAPAEETPTDEPPVEEEPVLEDAVEDPAPADEPPGAGGRR